MRTGLSETYLIQGQGAFNCGKPWTFSKEDSAIHLVGLKEYYLLWITSARYCVQSVSGQSERRNCNKTPRIGVFHHDNARYHVSLVVRNKLLTFDQDVLPHPPYSPDIGPVILLLIPFLEKLYRLEIVNICR